MKKIIIINLLSNLYSVKQEDIDFIEKECEGKATIYDKDTDFKDVDIIVGFNSNICFTKDYNVIKDTKENVEFITYIKDKRAIIFNIDKEIKYIRKPLIKVMIAVPCYNSIEVETLKSIYDLLIPDGVECYLEIAKGYTVDYARNVLAKTAIEKNYDYILWIDADIILPVNFLSQLLNKNEDIITGWYIKKIANTPGITELYAPDKFQRNSYTNIKEEELKGVTNVFQINACGFGCLLTKTEVFKKLCEDNKKPFVYVEDNNGAVISEDIYACINMTKLGYTIKADPTMRCTHIGKYNF